MDTVFGLRRKTEDEVVRIVDDLLDENHGGEVVAALKERGIVTQAGKSFSLARLQALRYAYHLKSHRERRREQGWQTYEEIARKIDGQTPHPSDLGPKRSDPVRGGGFEAKSTFSS